MKRIPFLTFILSAAIATYLSSNYLSDRSTPAYATLFEKAKILSVGSNHNCIVTYEGEAKCWGNNDNGKLGNGNTNEAHKPVNVIGLNQKIIDIGAGLAHTCALTSTGSVKCWGDNGAGQLGDGSNKNHFLPIDVIGLDHNVKSLSVGKAHNCVILDNGKVKCWGRNSRGALGDGSTIARNVPVDVIGNNIDIVAISAGEEHTCALTTSGGVKCWGYNGAGTLGNGSTIDRSTPVDVISLGDTVLAIATKTFSTCALLSDHSVKCWGFNFSGQLGDGTRSDRSLPVSVIGLDKDINALGMGGSGGGEGGGNHNCAITTSGAVKCWGANFHGELGDRTTLTRTSPVDAIGIQNGLSIGGGGGNTCVLMINGSVKCWGFNGEGRLGNGNTDLQMSPVDVVGLDGIARMVFFPLAINSTCDCEPNNDFQTATSILINKPIIGTVNQLNDSHDYFNLQLQPKKHYTVQLNYIGDADLDLYIYNSSYNQISASAESGNKPEQIKLVSDSGGLYYILITTYKTSGNQTYELVVTEE